ncbi:MAG: hypothetical protein IPH24_03040 [Crocinitomicaceae bacterium]|nr:hypothetical protein [Crocinitomicaceae bacterium]
MRSFYSHLEAVQSIGEEISSTTKPTYRSSAIFPVQHNTQYSSKIIFMGYWLLKRNIKEIGILYTLRNEMGQILSRKNSVIDSHKSYSISLDEFADKIGDTFIGSLELEIFSTRDLVFPYPAFVLVYYSDKFSTAVHTVGRIYNDIEDLVGNEEYVVRESGFDIYGDPQLESFLALTNGPQENEKPTFSYELNTKSGKTHSGSFTLNPIAPYQTVFVNLTEKMNLSEHLKNEAGSVKLGHNMHGFFPRFVVGNIQKNIGQISITHTYYDCSPLNDSKSFWNRKDDKFNDSAVAIPLYITGGYFTQVAVYPIFSPSDFEINCDFYGDKGEFLGSLKRAVEVKHSDNRYDVLDFETLCIAAGIDIQKAKVANLNCNWNDKTKIPTRVKFGLNVGMKNAAMKVPSNICFAPSLGNPKILEKAGTFRWAPFINIGTSEICITNSSTLKAYDRPAEIDLQFFREQDEAILKRKVMIPANGMIQLNAMKDSELKEFFGGESGWVTMQTTNPYIYGYDFDFFESGAVAADHIF